MNSIRRYIPIFIILVFAVCFVLLIAMKINLANADLGRHIENGRLILSGQAKALLSTNYYSYVHPDFPFINHHWASGVVFYLVYNMVGFEGLSVLYIALALAMFLVSFGIAIKKSNIAIASIVALLFMPILIDRKEVRPEVITYLFSIVFYAILWLYSEKKWNAWWLSALVLLEIVWVNMHIGFLFGELIVGAFLVSQLLKRDKDKKKIKVFTVLFAAIVGSTLLNPHFIRGAVYPLFIFSNYGYQLYENTSLFELESWGYYRSVYAVYKVMAILTWLSAVVYVIRKRDWKFIVHPLTLIMLGMTILSLQAIRNLVLFAVFAVPYFSYTLHEVVRANSWSKKVQNYIALGVVILLFGSTVQVLNARVIGKGIGLMPGVEKSAEFFKTNNLKGPIFNNYDIGSYLVYELRDQEKVFVENRPEAYPASFFSDSYIRPQYNDADWKALDAKYGFKVIWFYRYDLTQWGKIFLNKRTQDNDWALVYLDSYTVMFLRNTEETKALIEKYKIRSD